MASIVKVSRSRAPRAGATLIAVLLSPRLFSADSVDYATEVRPILSEHCFTCHGPDANSREADLRLDQMDEVVGSSDSSETPIVLPGKPEASELWARISATDPDDRMPPPEVKSSLSEEEKALIRRWISEGAPVEGHWAFRPVVRPEEPALNDPWIRNEIDAFVLQTLRANDLEPALEAAPQTLIRRVFLDLTGAPPSLEELDAYLSDQRPGRYERWIERLMGRASYAEKMAGEWMDVARFADTFGYQADRPNKLWPYRDWVIDAFRDRMPFDQFITWQLAGDLLPEPSREQILATAFNRNHRQTNEGGSVPEEFRVEYNADRVETTSMAFLGLTMNCARCHDHKYDPISQRDYYEFMGYFNSTDEAGLYSHFTDAVPSPTLLLYEGDQEKRHQALKRRIAELEGKLEDRRNGSQETFKQWIEKVGERLTLEAKPIVSVGFDKIVDGKFPDHAAPDKAATRHDSPGLSEDGVFGSAVAFSGDNSVEVPGAQDFERTDRFTLDWRMWAPEKDERIVVLHQCQAYTDAGSRGYEVLLEDGHLTVALIHFYPGNALKVRVRDPFPLKEWKRVTVAYDGSSQARGVQVFIDGEPTATEVVRDQLFKTILYSSPGRKLTLGARFRDVGFKNGRIDALRVYDRRLSGLEIRALDTPKRWETAVATEDVDLSILRDHYFWACDDRAQEIRRELADVREAENTLINDVREVMVMGDLPEPRPTYVLDRGVYDERRERVEPGFPESIFNPDREAPPNRIGLAEWITDPNNPLTSRVTVNRYWAQFFGAGIVRTPEDFGSQGAAPTHPKLLDWLAHEFVSSGWNLQALQKKMLMSATYRQSSKGSAESRAKDPENRLLARGPSYRLPAESIRDSAISMAGLLDPTVGGPSVKTGEYGHKSADAQDGEPAASGMRRSLYTYIQRTAPPPFLLTFDATSRERCIVQREITNTPLQSLILLNDSLFNRTARGMAKNELARDGDSETDRLSRLFRTATSRRPTPEESEALRVFFKSQMTRFQADPEAALQYLDLDPEAEDVSKRTITWAALSAVANAILSLDETITKR